MAITEEPEARGNDSFVRERLDRPDPGDDLDLREILRPIERHWWLLVVLPLLALGVAWLTQRDVHPQYTAEVLFQRTGEQAELAAFPAARQNLQPKVAAEMVVLRSRAVLGPVVDSLGLQVELHEPVPRSGLFEEVRVGEGAPEEEYRLVPEENGDGFALLDERRGSVLSRAASGGWVHGPGFRLRLHREPVVDGPVRLSILPRERAVERLRSGILLQQVGETPIIRARFTDPDPLLATEVVRALTRSYQTLATRQARTEAVRRREFLASILESAEDSLMAAQEAILRYQERSGSVSPQQETSALREMVMEGEEELRTVRTSEEILRTLHGSLQAGEVDDEALRRTLILGRGVVPNIDRLYSDLMDLRAERTRLTASRFGLTEQGSQVEVVDSLIAEKRAELQAIVQQSLESLPDRRRLLNDQVENLRALLSDLPAESAALARLEQRLDRVESRYRVLADRFYEAQIAAAVEAGDIEVVDPPVVPFSPDPSRAPRIYGLSLLIGLLLGAAAAFVMDRLDTSVQDEEEAERASGLRVLSLIPLVEVPSNGRAAGRPVMIEHATPGGESFRKLRTMLRFVREQRPRILSVTSAGPGEGKSVVAQNLALAFARESSPVLLVDADMRRPTAAVTFGLDPSRSGLSDLLIGDVDFDEVVHHDSEHGVDVLTAGTPVPNPAELIGGKTFPVLLRTLRETYRMVIIDTPPVLAVADATLIGPQTEGVLTVVRIDATPRGALEQAANELRQVGAPLLGLVLNGVTDGGGYGYGYRRYAAYYTGEDGGNEKSGGRVRRWLTAMKS